MMSVGLSNKGKPLKLRHYDINRAHVQGTAQRLFYIRLPAEDGQKHGEDKFGRLVKSIYGVLDASHIWQLDYVNLICGDFWDAAEEANTAQHCATIQIKMWSGNARRRLCVCQTMMDSNTSTVFSNPNTQRKTWWHLDSKIRTWKNFRLLKRVFRVGVDQTGQYLDIEPDLSHAPLIITESGRDTNTEALSTPLEKLQGELVLDGR